MFGLTDCLLKHHPYTLNILGHYLMAGGQQRPMPHFRFLNFWYQCKDNQQEFQLRMLSKITNDPLKPGRRFCVF